MVREGINGGQVSSVSSIALLQERFKQLQRMKEVRKEKELGKRMEVSSTPSSSPSQSHFLSPPTHEYPYCQLSLSLCCPPDHYSDATKHADSRGAITKVAAPSNIIAKSTHSPTFNLQTSDHISTDHIDTSLRL